MHNLKRKPTHPGKVLKEDFLDALNLTQSQLAKEIKTTFRTINEIINEKRSVSPSMALKLSKYFGTSVELWLNLQNQWDVYCACEKERDSIADIKPYAQLHRYVV